MNRKPETSWHVHCARGIIDAIIDVGRDLKRLSTCTKQTLINVIEARIGTPLGDMPPALDDYYDYMKRLYDSGEKWAEGRSAGYVYFQRMLSYVNTDSDGVQALINLSVEMEGLYRDGNTLSDGGLEKFTDTIQCMLGSPPKEDEGYADGYVNMLRMIEYLAQLKGC